MANKTTSSAADMPRVAITGTVLVLLLGGLWVGGAFAPSGPVAELVSGPVAGDDAEPQEDAETAEATAGEADVPEAAEVAEAEAAEVDAPVADVAEATVAPEPVVEPAPEPAIEPEFDVVRVEPSGEALIAGRAAPGAEVTLSLGGEAVATVVADAGGDFVAFLSVPPSENPQVLSLSTRDADGTAQVADGSAIIAPIAPIAPVQPVEPVEPEEPAVEIAEAPVAEDAVEAIAELDVTEGAEAPDAAPAALAEASEETANVSGQTDAGSGDDLAGDDATPGEVATEVARADTTALADAPVLPGTDNGTDVSDASDEAPAETSVTEAEAEAVPQTEAVAETAPSEPQAPAVLLADGDGVRVLQGGAPQVQTDVQLDAITYNIDGDVVLSGRGPAASDLRIMLDNRPIQLGEVGPGGDWSLDLPDVDPGTYTLRVEQLASDGSVASRIETPFLREDPVRLVGNPMLLDPGASVITVQPGFTLWGIAEANFGDGILFVQIFQENRDQIRNPDLIFPGQFFDIPDLPRLP